MQRSSTKLRDVEQLSLLPERKQIVSAAPDLTYIPRLKDTADALDYACRLASVAPKGVYLPMDVDKGTWSRICGGEFDLDGRDVPKFNRIIGNSAYLLYLNYLDGWDLASMRRAQDDKDRRIADLEQRLVTKDLEMKVLIDFHKATR